MILAAPLVIPFAEAIGLSVAVLGMAKIGDEVNKYIESNPEESAMILKTLVPNLGIGEIFMNKEDSGDDEEVSEEEVTESESGSTKDMVLEELNKEKGNYSDPEAKGNYASPRGRIIGRLRREGKIRQGNDPNYDPSKKYQGYKRFIRPKKADGGAIGIEVLFEPKRDNFIYGGTVHSDGRRGFFKGAQADTKKGKSMSPGTTASGGFKGGNNNNNNNSPPVIIPKGNTPEPITFNDITGKKMLPADLAIQKQFLNLIKNKGYETGLDTEADDLYNAYRTATGLDNFQTNALVNSTTNILDKGTNGVFEKFVDRNSTITDLDTGKSTKQLMVETPTGLIQRTVRPSGIMENDIAQPFGAPQSLSVDPYYKFAEGGRVGLFMGGSPLEGQALAIYNSMNAYGFDDQAIANALTEQGYYTPPESGTPQTTTPNIINSQLNKGGDNFSAFNTDPNRIKSFTPAKNAAAPMNSNLSLQGDYDIYGNKIKETLNPLQSGIRSVKNTMASVMDNPVFQTIGAVMNPAFAAAKGVATLFKDKLPVNQRAITENIAGQQGVRVDDIGRIVNTGKYTDPNNVMAGYNLNQMTEETFDNRIGNIAETLAGKYGMTPTEIQEAIEGTYTGPVNTSLLETIRAINLSKINITNIKNLGIQAAKKEQEIKDIARANRISREEAQGVRDAIDRDNAIGAKSGQAGSGTGGVSASGPGSGGGYNEGNRCFEPNTLIQMTNGSEKKIKDIQLGDDTKGGEVTGVFQFKVNVDEIHNYKGVTVAGSHFVKEDGKFIMVKDSPLSVKIDKIPVVYSLDTTGRRIFIKDIEFADYNGDGVAKNFLTNAGVDLTGFDTEVLRQVENRLI